jgi:Holliday junction DNA helicase RuvA
VFQHLLAVQSVGPAKAMGILETPVGDFIELVAQKNPARLARLPGVGKKTAERIILDLYEKLLALRPAGAAIEATSSELPRTRVADDLVSALVNLGYRDAVAEEAAADAIARLGQDAKLEDLLRTALAQGRP